MRELGAVAHPLDCRPPSCSNGQNVSRQAEADLFVILT